MAQWKDSLHHTLDVYQSSLSAAKHWQLFKHLMYELEHYSQEPYMLPLKSKKVHYI